jgi:arylsulfatase A-like enzyme
MSQTKVLLSILAFLILLGSLSCTRHQVADKPNVVLILSDDQGWGDLSLTGNSNLSTPNLDRMAERGVFFERFFVSPVCSPTRAELLTGRYHARGGVYSTSIGGERLDLDEATIAEMFRNAGYKTAAYGKWHNGMQYPYHPNARGFDEYYGFCSGHWGNYFSPMLERNGALVKGEGFLTDDLTNNAISFIEENKDQPFFVYLPYNTPHSPMQVPDRWWKKFSDAEFEMTHRDPGKEKIQHTRAALAMCENIDWNVGRVIGRIRELGLEENTIIIYFSDNGPNGWRWNDGMKGRKGSVDEGGVRSPLIIQWPGRIDAGKRIDKISAVIDLFPTLAELAGIEYQPRNSFDGVSLEPLIMNYDHEWKERLIFNHWGSRTSVRGQQYRLDESGFLFDMQEDPGQAMDIAGEKPEVVSRMKMARAEWEAKVLAELPEEDLRPFVLGHPDYSYTQIPARDGKAEGNIKRSSRYPNCSFFTNWISTDDRISWDVEVPADGDFEVEVYYTCQEKDVGAVFELSFENSRLSGKITEAHDPPLTGMENDRDERIESYVKEFKPFKMGIIHLEQGKGILELKAIDIPGSHVMDFRLLMLKRI